MLCIKELNPEYIIDKNGQKKFVVIPISDFQEFIEDIEDLTAVAERRDEPNVSHNELLTYLKKGYICSLFI